MSLRYAAEQGTRFDTVNITTKLHLLELLTEQVSTAIFEATKLLLSSVAISIIVYIGYLYGFWTPNPSTVMEWIDNGFVIFELVVDFFLIGASIYVLSFDRSVLTENEED